MKERERRFHILQPGVSSVAHIAQLSAASLLLGTLWSHCDHWPVLWPLRCPGVDCPLRAGGHETRGRAPPQHTGSRGPEDGWSGGGHIAVQCGHHPDHGATCPLSLTNPSRQDGSSHCLMVKHLCAGCVLARPRVCCDRMTARAEVNI